MHQVTIPATALAALLAALTFFTIGEVVTADALRALALAALLASSLAVCVRYGPASLQALKEGGGRGEALVVAVFGLAACACLGAIWALLRASPVFPAYLTRPVLLSGLIWAGALGFALALMAPAPRRFPWGLLTGAAVGLILALHPFA